MMTKLKHIGPLIIVAMIPALLLTFRSARMVQVVFFAAMLSLSYLAGESLAQILPRRVALGLAIVSVLAIAIAVASGWIRAGGSTPASFGALSLIAVAVGAPVKAVVVQRQSGQTAR
ncbi:hypothetical protein KKG90_07660 [Candidatus Bipolaricaulota bacterium]|nr:hypothetical protein [Candidatus Bipolaricaulota bacterium]